MGSICPKSLRIQELGPRPTWRQATSRCLHYPWAQTWTQASWPSQEPPVPRELTCCYKNRRRNRNARNQSSSEWSATYTGQPDWCMKLQWNLQSTNNKAFYGSFKLTKKKKKRLPKRTQKVKHPGLKMQRQHHTRGNLIWKFSEITQEPSGPETSEGSL